MLSTQQVIKNYLLNEMRYNPYLTKLFQEPDDLMQIKYSTVQVLGRWELE